MNTQKRAFSAITEAGAKILHRALPAAREAGCAGVTFQGGWVNRRLVLLGGRAEREMPRHTSNPVALTVTVPVTNSPLELMRAFRSFGATVERLWRDDDRGRFDLVVSADDGDRHIAHRFHHIALCGHKARRWLSDDEAGSLAFEVQACPKCVTAAATKPIYRARWHPSATNDQTPSQGSSL